MAKPKKFDIIQINQTNPKSPSRVFLEVFKNELKDGTKYSIGIPTSQFDEAVRQGIYQAKLTLASKSYLYSVEIKDDKLNFKLTKGVSIGLVINTIRDEIQGEVNVWEAKNLNQPAQTPVTTSTPSANSTIEDYIKNYGITIADVLKRLGWSDGLKKSMEDDFVNSGFFYLDRLVGDDSVVDIAYNIKNYIAGFNTGKNTYLQAKMIAEEIEKMYFESLNIKSIRSANVTPNIDKIYGVSVYGSTTGEKIEILDSLTDSSLETNIVYQIRQLDGTETTAIRDRFIVAGDTIQVMYKSGDMKIFKVIEIGDIPLLKVKNDNGIYYGWDKSYFDEIEDIVILEYDNLKDKVNKVLPQNNSTSTIPSAPNVASSPTNAQEPIYGIMIRGTYSSELVTIIKPYSGDAIEKYYEYECSLQGKTSILPRNNFMVVGDVIKVTFDTGEILEFKILVLQNDTTIKVMQSAGNAENWNIGGFDWDEGKIEILEYYNLHEKFDSIGISQAIQPAPLPAQPKAPKKTLSDDEKEIEKIKKDVANLIFLKSTFSPVEFEDTITIGQKIDEKQKQINDLNLVIVDKKLKGNKIFDDLFEQSFTPIKNRYDVYVSNDVENTDFFAPNGDKSILKNSINEIIRTPLFKDWFGDWQMAYNYRDIPNSGVECSKVVDKNYEPLIVWHGTGAQFSYFRFDNFPAAYFAVKKQYSDFFARIQSGGGEGYVMPFFLNLRNPLDLTKFHTNEVSPKDFFDYLYVMTGMTPVELEVNPIFLDPNTPAMWVWRYLRNNAKMLKKLADSHVYDGIHFYENNPNLDESDPAYITEAYITFNPNSCKIADPDRGDLILASMKSFLLEKGGKI
jgi:hypothetical protein